MKKLRRLLSPKILVALGTVLLLSLFFWQLGALMSTRVKLCKNSGRTLHFLMSKVT